MNLSFDNQVFKQVLEMILDFFLYGEARFSSFAQDFSKSLILPLVKGGFSEIHQNLKKVTETCLEKAWAKTEVWEDLPEFHDESFSRGKLSGSRNTIYTGGYT